MSMIPFAEPLLLTQSLELTAQFLGLAALAAVLTAIVATASQYQYDRIVPREFVLLLGLSSVAGYLMVAGFGGAVAPGTGVDGGIPLALFALAAFLVGAGGALLGRHVGNRFAADVLADWDGITVDAHQKQDAESSTTEVQQVTLPERITDSTGYDPVDEEVKAALSGATFEYPQLPPDELEARLERRLQAEYGLAHIDISVTADGSITEVTVGNRDGGIGKTLPAETTAVAIQADPAPTATPGDRVQVWEADPMRRVVTGELRGIAGDTVTIAIAASDTPRIDPRRTYRLVTLPAADRAPQEFAERLTDAKETYATATVAAGSPLHGMSVGALSLAIISLTRDDGTTVSLPGSKTRLTPGTELSAIGKPSALRTLQRASEPLDPSLVPAADNSQTATSAQPQPEPTAESAPASNLPAKTESPSLGDLDSPAEQPAATEPPSAAEATVESPEPIDSLDEPPTTDSPGTGIKGKADSNRFEELKAEFDAEETAVDEFSAATESVAEESGSASAEDSTADESELSKDETSGSTFSELKAEFDSGEADWATSATDEEPEANEESVEDSEMPAEDTETESDELVSLEEADISFGETSEENESSEEIDDTGEDDLSALSFDEEDSDGLFDNDADDGFVFGDGDADDERERNEDEEGDDESEDDEGEDDEEDSSGGSTFAQLKEEFESGEADWADDISDSPGGDMRLDE